MLLQYLLILFSSIENTKYFYSPSQKMQKSDLPVKVTYIYIIENCNALENQGVSVTTSRHSYLLLPTSLHTKHFLILTHSCKTVLSSFL